MVRARWFFLAASVGLTTIVQAVVTPIGAFTGDRSVDGVGAVLRITQRELGYLVGLSRQRVNEALGALERQGLIRVEYGGVKVLDLDGLRARR